MAVSKTGLIVPKFGALFTAAEGTSPLAALHQFTKAAGPSGDTWTHWGHLSRENLPENSTDGGDSTTLSTWLEENTDSETEASVDSVVYSLLQHDAVTIAAASALNGTKASVLEMWFSSTKRFGIWYPSAKMALSGRPSPNGTDQYAESKITATILTPGSGVGLAGLANPSAGLAPWPSATNPNTLYIEDKAFAEPEEG